jgi:hypothetical protein
MKIRRGLGLLRWGSLGLVVVGSACGPSPAAQAPAQPAPAETSKVAAKPVAVAPQVEPLPQLAFGDLPPLEYDKVVAGRVVALDQSEDFQTLLIEVRLEGLSPELARSVDGGLFARVVGSQLQAPGLLASSEVASLVPPSTEGMFQFWVRRDVPSTSGKAAASESAPGTIDVDVFTAAGLRLPTYEPSDTTPDYKYEPGQHFRVTAPLPAKLAAQPKVLAAYLEALGNVAPESPASWFWGRDVQGGATNPAWERDQVSREWADMMRFSTGYDSVEAALITEQKLRAPLAPKAATVPLASLKRPELLRHEWARMLGALSGITPVEPLATMVPAEFYYLRARSFDAFQSLLDRVDRAVTPAVRVLERHRQQLDLSERYRLELGLPQDELSRVLGPHLVHSLVITGSDPMLRQGSDVSLILDVPASETVLNVLSVKRAQLSQQYPLTATNWAHAGVSVSSYQSVDGRVRQEVASFKRGDGKTFVLLSNSKNAVQRVLDTWTGQHGSLASELDFQYMLKRDANVAEDVLVYFGDRFVAEVVSPAQRIVDSRRQVAKAELMALSAGSLLFAGLYGRTPTDAKELGSKPWFGVQRLRHAAGETIGYDKVGGVSSAWGTPARLTSIIDLPVPKRVSKEEQAAYDQFAQGYQGQWGERIDPIALRVKVSSQQLDAHLRVLPVMNRGDYDDVLRWSGGGLTTRAPSLPGLAGILAIGDGSPLREFLSGNGRSFLGNKFKLDWLGDWVELGLVDDPALADLVIEHGDLPEAPSAPRREEGRYEEDYGKVPAYLALDLDSAAGASIVLTMLREMATGASPDTVKWGEHGKHGETTIMRVAVEDVNVYYALTKRRLLVSLQASVLERLLDNLDAELKGTPVTAGGVGGQLVLEVAPNAGPGSLVAQSAMRTVASWLIEKGVHYSSFYDPWAELLLRGAVRGAPSSVASEEYETLAFRWLGMKPVTAEGKQFLMTAGGVADPDRGSLHAPKWPKVPVSPGLVEQVLESVTAIRTEVSVDNEPGSEDRSLRAQLRLKMRDAQPATAPKP